MPAEWVCGEHTRTADRLFRGVFEAYADGYDAWVQAGYETGARASRLTIGTAHAFTIAPDG